MLKNKYLSLALLVVNGFCLQTCAMENNPGTTNQQQAPKSLKALAPVATSNNQQLSSEDIAKLPADLCKLATLIRHCNNDLNKALVAAVQGRADALEIARRLERMAENGSISNQQLQALLKDIYASMLSPEEISKLIECGAPVDSENSYKRTLLIIAISSQDTALVRTLLEKIASSITIQDKTALLYHIWLPVNFDGMAAGLVKELDFETARLLIEGYTELTLPIITTIIEVVNKIKDFYNKDGLSSLASECDKAIEFFSQYLPDNQ
jgi:ankyrin repeat protein